MSTAVIDRIVKKGLRRAIWASLVEDETGLAAEVFRDRLVVQVTGTFDGETIEIHGSIDGTNYFPLTVDGTALLEFTADGLLAAYEAVGFIRPVATLDAAGTVDVEVIADSIVLGHG